jgi:glucose/arabinose dehydrogenase
MMMKIVALACACALSAAAARADTVENQSFTVDKIYQGSGVIWGFDFVSATSASEIVFSERAGALRHLDVPSGAVHDIAGAPKVWARGQGGLLDVLIDHRTGLLYLTYAEPLDGDVATTSLYRGRLSADGRTLAGARLFQGKASSGDHEQFGARVAIDAQGHIYFGIGDRNERPRVQDLGSDLGKILRLNQDGSIPADNPYVHTAGALPEIWSIGHRNPQGLAFDADGNLLEDEFGPRGGDELNLIRKGANYGWPLATYGREYYGPIIGSPSVAGTVQPLVHWVPSINPSGLMRYHGQALPGFEGNIFMASLSGHLHRVVVDRDWRVVREDRLLEDIGQRFRQVRTGPDGLIYVSTDNGAIYRIKPQ